MTPSFTISVTEQSHNHVTLHVTLPHRLEVTVPLSRWDANKIALAIRTDTPIPFRIISRTGVNYNYHGKNARQRITITFCYEQTKGRVTLGHYETRRVADLLAPLPEGDAE